MIGGGPAGLISARELLKENHQITIYEKTNDIGGVWKLENITSHTNKNTILDLNTCKKSNVHSSLYDKLRTNLPREIMGVPDFPFDTNFEGSIDDRRFCHHEEVTLI